MRTPLRIGLLVLAFAITFSGCGGGSEACPHCFTDDFSSAEASAEAGWPFPDDDARVYSITDDEYVVTLKKAPASRFTGPDLVDAEGNLLEITDATVSVTGRVTAGAPVMGLVCRWETDPPEGTFPAGYAFGVTEQRYVLKRSPSFEDITRGDLPEGTDLTQPTKLEATCKGDELTFSVNGTEVLRIEDAALESGQLGLLLAANRDATVPATVTYDDFEVANAD